MPEKFAGGVFRIDAGAIALAEAGVQVIACGRRERLLDELVSALGEGARSIIVDLRSRESMDAMFDTVGAIDILINCAGVAPKAPVLSGDYEQFAELLERYFEGDEDQLVALKEDLHMLDPQDVAASVLHILRAPSHVEIGDIQLRSSDQKL